MATLSPQQIRQLSDMLDARFTREMDEIDTLIARARNERGQAALAERQADLLDVALAEVTSADDAAIVRQDIDDVRDITAARKRVAAGTYGICSDCGEPIVFERLLAYPTAKRCIACQRAHESGQAVRAGRRVR